MARKAKQYPTAGELEILQILWAEGSATVRQVNDILNQTKSAGNTTTLKIMQIMLDKGLVTRDTSTRPQVYSAAVSKDSTERQLVGDLLDRMFEGSASQFVMQILASKNSSPQEMGEIRRLINEASSKGNK